MNDGIGEVTKIADLLVKKYIDSNCRVDSIQWSSLTDDPMWFEATATYHNGTLRVGVITFSSDVSPGKTLDRGLEPADVDVLHKQYGYDFMIKGRKLPDTSVMGTDILRVLADKTGKSILTDCHVYGERPENRETGFYMEFQALVGRQLVWRSLYSRDRIENVYGRPFEVKVCKHPTFDYELEPAKA